MQREDSLSAAGRAAGGGADELVHGRIEREERSVNVIAERFEGFTIAADAERRVHNFG